MLRVRRRFWILFGWTIFFALGLAVLPLAAGPQTPRQLQVVVSRESLGKTVSLQHPPTLLVQIVDADGRLVDNANLQTAANMTGMDMGPLAFHPRQVGRGLYVLDLSFSMPGSWWVRLERKPSITRGPARRLPSWSRRFRSRAVLISWPGSPCIPSRTRCPSHKMDGACVGWETGKGSLRC